MILGTVAVRDPDLVRQACRRFPGRVAVGIDARGGRVAVEGWAETSELSVIDLARRFEGAGVAAIIYTDIDRDGIDDIAITGSSGTVAVYLATGDGNFAAAKQITCAGGNTRQLWSRRISTTTASATS